MQKEQQMQTKPSPLTETVSRPTGIKMALLLFWEFIKLGAFTFGSGWSIIAQMEQEFVDKRHWVEQSDLLELIAVGKSLPGSWWPTSCCCSVTSWPGRWAASSQRWGCACRLSS